MKLAGLALYHAANMLSHFKSKRIENKKKNKTKISCSEKNAVVALCLCVYVAVVAVKDHPQKEYNRRVTGADETYA